MFIYVCTELCVYYNIIYVCTELRDRSRETKVKTEKNTNTAFYNNLSNRK